MLKILCFPKWVFATITWATMFMLGWWASFWEKVMFFRMKFYIHTIMNKSRYKFQIFKSIVGFIPIYMMNMFRLIKFSSKKLFHYKTMLINIFFRIDILNNITISKFSNSTLPIPAFFSFGDIWAWNVRFIHFSLIPWDTTFFKFGSNRTPFPIFNQHDMYLNITGDIIQV